MSALKVGTLVRDPLGREWLIQRIDGDMAIGRLGGSYAATVHLPLSALVAVGRLDHLTPPSEPERGTCSHCGLPFAIAEDAEGWGGGGGLCWYGAGSGYSAGKCRNPAKGGGQ